MWFFFQWCAWLCDPQYFFYITVQILKTLCFPLLRQGPQSHSFNFTDFFLFVFFVYFIWMSCSLVDGLVNKKKNYLWTLSHFHNRTSVFNITFQTKFVKCPHIIPLKNKKKIAWTNNHLLTKRKIDKHILTAPLPPFCYVMPFMVHSYIIVI